MRFLYLLNVSLLATNQISLEIQERIDKIGFNSFLLRKSSLTNCISFCLCQRTQNPNEKDLLTFMDSFYKLIPFSGQNGRRLYSAFKNI